MKMCEKCDIDTPAIFRVTWEMDTMRGTTLLLCEKCTTEVYQCFLNWSQSEDWKASFLIEKIKT